MSPRNELEANWQFISSFGYSEPQLFALARLSPEYQNVFFEIHDQSQVVYEVARRNLLGLFVNAKVDDLDKIKFLIVDLKKKKFSLNQIGIMIKDERVFSRLKAAKDYFDYLIFNFSRDDIVRMVASTNASRKLEFMVRHNLFGVFNTLGFTKEETIKAIEKWFFPVFQQIACHFESLVYLHFSYTDITLLIKYARYDAFAILSSAYHKFKDLDLSSTQIIQIIAHADGNQKDLLSFLNAIYFLSKNHLSQIIIHQMIECFVSNDDDRTTLYLALEDSLTSVSFNQEEHIAPNLEDLKFLLRKRMSSMRQRKQNSNELNESEVAYKRQRCSVDEENAVEEFDGSRWSPVLFPNQINLSNNNSNNNNNNSNSNNNNSNNNNSNSNNTQTANSNTSFINQLLLPNIGSTFSEEEYLWQMVETSKPKLLAANKIEFTINNAWMFYVRSLYADLSIRFKHSSYVSAINTNGFDKIYITFKNDLDLPTWMKFCSQLEASFSLKDFKKLNEKFKTLMPAPYTQASPQLQRNYPEMQASLDSCEQEINEQLAKLEQEKFKP